MEILGLRWKQLGRDWLVGFVVAAAVMLGLSYGVGGGGPAQETAQE